MTQNDFISNGLDLCRDRLGVDGSAVIPSVVGGIFAEFKNRTCDNCKWLSDLGFCVNFKSIGYGKDIFEDSIKSDIGCNKFERKE